MWCTLEPLSSNHSVRVSSHFVLALFVFYSLIQTVFLYNSNSNVQCFNKKENIECDPYMTTMVILERGNSHYQHVLSNNVFLPGPNNSSWSRQDLSVPISLTFDIDHCLNVLPLVHVGHYYNVFIREEIVSSCEKGRFCCSQNTPKGFQKQYALEKDTSQGFDIFESTDESLLKYQVNVLLKQGIFSAGLTMNEVKIQASWPDKEPNVFSSVFHLVMTKFLPSIPKRNYLVVPTSGGPFFLINKIYFDPTQVRRIGFNQEVLDSTLLGSNYSNDCNLHTIQQLTIVNGGLHDNQFGSFQNDTLKQLLPHFPFTLDTEKKSIQFDVLNSVSFILTVQSSAKLLQLKRMSMNIVIKDKRYSFSKQIDHEQFSIYLNLANQEGFGGNITVKNTLCCFDDPLIECAVVFDHVSLYLEAYQQAQCTLSQPIANRPFNSGTCFFSIIQIGQVLIDNISITFKLTPIPVVPSPYQPQPLPISTSCTIDQILNAQLKICLPVDCIVKYEGKRNSYDPLTGLCIDIRICDKNQIWFGLCRRYDEDDHPEIIPSQNTDTSYLDIPIDCGPHGRVDIKDPNICACDVGWKTRVQQSSLQRVFCDLNVMSNGFVNQLVLHRDVTDNQPLPPYPALIIAGIVLGCILLVLLIIWAFIWYRRRNMAKIKFSDKYLEGQVISSEDELDSFDSEEEYIQALQSRW